MVSRAWMQKYPESLTNITSNPTLQIATANGTVTSENTGTLNIKDPSGSQTIRCRILNTDICIPPLIGETSLPPFKYSSTTGNMEFNDQSSLTWNKDS